MEFMFMEYENIETLEEFFKSCEKLLLSEDNRTAIEYPEEFIVPWESDDLKNKNEETLKKISGEANVYAIFTALKDADEYSLRYIGQTKSKLARTRLTNHLISKHEKTGAKLSKVIDHIQSGGSIKISWISINPESLRHYVEERLIEEHSECDWNKQGKKT
jgi:hypothetical protein